MYESPNHEPLNVEVLNVVPKDVLPAAAVFALVGALSIQPVKGVR